MRKTNTRKSKLLALFLSMMLLSSTATMLACDEETPAPTPGDDSSTEETVEDTGLIVNAGFETFDEKDGLNLIGTKVTGWTNALNSSTSGTKALAQQAASGIIDTSEEAWDNLTLPKLSGIKAKDLTEEEAKEKWDEMSARDKLEYYSAWKKATENEDKALSSLSFYEAFNIDEEDIPTCQNPGTHYADDDTENAENTKVLMIHNHHEDKNDALLGTAQKYTSTSTVTVSAGTSAKLSLWVKTSDLTSWNAFSGESQDAVDKGAYIRVTNSLGGTSLDAVEIKNINTAGVTENNGWVQYSMVLKGSTFADTTFTVVLGLGQGVKSDQYEFVNGYAFFDDIEVETLTNSEYEKLVDVNEDGAKDAGVYTITIAEENEERIVEAKDVKDVTLFDLDYSEGAQKVGGSEILDLTWNFTDTQEEKGKDKNGNPVYYTSVLNGKNGAKTWQGLGFDGTGDSVEILTSCEALNGSGDTFKQKIYDNYFKDTETDNDFLKNLNEKKALFFLSKSGASYTAKTEHVELGANSHVLLSFFVKTSDMEGFKGAGVRIENEDNTLNASAITEISTPQIEGVKIGKIEDYYDGWQKCYLFLSNATDKMEKVSIAFSFGPTTVTDTTESSYQAGFAAFTGFETYVVEEEMLDYVKTGTYVKLLELKEKDEVKSSNTFDAEIAVSERPLEEGFANLKNYRGVSYESDYVTVNGTGNNLLINTSQTAGLLSKKYLQDEDGVENADYTAILNSLGATGSNNDAKWSSVFGSNDGQAEANQPLVIYNGEQNATAYGFIGNERVINGYTAVSVRVKVSEGAKAYIYLIDTDKLDEQTALTLGRNQTYWYDDEGNVCASDPSKSAFNARKDTAFKLQANGLYKVNTSWSGASGIDANAYYANLSVYGKDADGNLVVAENGVSYNYNEKWLNDGNDGIAFYYDEETNKYYADSAKTIEVNDLATVADLARYEAKESKKAVIEVAPTYANGTDKTDGYAWVTVSFFVHAGDEAKNVRLEVWSGARDGSYKSEKGSFVIYDASGIETIEEGAYLDKLDERKEDLVEDEDYFEGVFSFYDTAKFLRYDETMDKNGVGNSYDDYLSSAYNSGVAYLYYTDSDAKEMYLDYKYSEIAVAEDVEEEDNTNTEEDVHEHENETNVWLLASSIILVAVLFFAIGSVVLRAILKKYGKKIRIKKPKKEKVKKAKKVKADKKQDEDSPYND